MPKPYNLMQHQYNVKVMALAQAQANLWNTTLATILLSILFFISFLKSLVWGLVAGG